MDSGSLDNIFQSRLSRWLLRREHAAWSRVEPLQDYPWVDGPWALSAQETAQIAAAAAERVVEQELWSYTLLLAHQKGEGHAPEMKIEEEVAPDPASKIACLSLPATTHAFTSLSPRKASSASPASSACHPIGGAFMANDEKALAGQQAGQQAGPQAELQAEQQAGQQAGPQLDDAAVATEATEATEADVETMLTRAAPIETFQYEDLSRNGLFIEFASLLLSLQGEAQSETQPLTATGCPPRPSSSSRPSQVWNAAGCLASVWRLASVSRCLYSCAYRVERRIETGLIRHVYGQ